MNIYSAAIGAHPAGVTLIPGVPTTIISTSKVNFKPRLPGTDYNPYRFPTPSTIETEWNAGSILYALKYFSLINSINPLVVITDTAARQEKLAALTIFDAKKCQVITDMARKI